MYSNRNEGSLRKTGLQNSCAKFCNFLAQTPLSESEPLRSASAASGHAALDYLRAGYCSRQSSIAGTSQSAAFLLGVSAINTATITASQQLGRRSSHRSISNMQVPKRIVVNFPKDEKTNGNNHAPADFYDSDSDYDYDDDQDTPPRRLVEPGVRVMSPPEKLTPNHISEEERRRFIRDTSMSGANVAYLADDSMYRTPNDTVLKNMTSFSSGDPVSVARQVRHLHNRVKLLEEELQTQHNRQIFLIGVVSVFIISRGIKWLVP